MRRSNPRRYRERIRSGRRYHAFQWNPRRDAVCWKMSSIKYSIYLCSRIFKHMTSVVLLAIASIGECTYKQRHWRLQEKFRVGQSRYFQTRFKPQIQVSKEVAQPLALGPNALICVTSFETCGSYCIQNTTDRYFAN